MLLLFNFVVWSIFLISNGEAFFFPSTPAPFAPRSAALEPRDKVDKELASQSFNFSLKDSAMIDLLPSLKVTCVQCETWGELTLTTSQLLREKSFRKKLLNFFKHPVNTIVDSFGLNLKLSFGDFGGVFAFDVLANDRLAYEFPIFMSESPYGIALSNDFSIGFVLFIDLVFSSHARDNLDMSIGFEFSFPEGSYLYVDPLRGKIFEDNFKQGPVNSLPIIVRSGRSEFAAALRVRFQGGVTIMHSGTGYDFELAIFANLLEYHNRVQRSNYTDIDPAELDPSLIDGTCNLLVSQSLDTTYGSYAHAVAHINYLKKGFSPTSQKTVFETTLATSCLDNGTPQTQSPTPVVISSSKNAVPTKIVSSEYLNYATVAPDDDYMPEFPAIRPVIVIPRATHIP